MKFTLVREGDTITIDADGRRLLPLAYMTYRPMAENYTSFANIGVNLCSFGVYAPERGINSLSGIGPFRRGFFRGYGDYDFSEVFADLALALDTNPDMYVIPRVYLDCPLWWEELHPDELARTPSGIAVRQSFASQKWLDDMSAALEALIEAVEASPYADRVAGYQAAAGGTEEWTYHGYRYHGEYCDYSQVNRAAYNRFLGDKLGASYDEPIPAPFERAYSCGEGLRNPAADKNVLLYLEYHSLAIAEAIARFCRVIKTKTCRVKLAGAFYGYTCELSDPEKGHHALSHLLSNGDIDFFASPVSYFNVRGDGIDWPFMAATDSAKLHGKLWFIEADVRTSLTQPFADALPYAKPANGYYSFEGVWRGPSGTAKSLDNIKKVFAKVLCSHVGTWWFDMWGGWYNLDCYMDFYREAMRLYKDNLPAVPVAEVAVVIDEQSCRYYAPGNGGLFEALYLSRRALGAAGAPYEMYLLSDIKHDSFPAGRFKTVLFMGCARIDRETRHAIDTRLKCGGRTLVWVYLNGIFDENGADCRGVESITDFAFESEMRRRDPVSYKGGTFPNAATLTYGFTADTLSNARIIAGNGDLPAVAGKTTTGGYTSVCSILPNLHENLLRDIYTLSGVHVYHHGGAVVYGDSRHLCVYTVSGGYNRVYLPRRACLYDSLTGEKLCDNTDFYDFPAEPHQTFIWQYTPKE